MGAHAWDFARVQSTDASTFPSTAFPSWQRAHLKIETLPLWASMARKLAGPRRRATHSSARRMDLCVISRCTLPSAFRTSAQHPRLFHYQGLGGAPCVCPGMSVQLLLESAPRAPAWQRRHSRSSSQMLPTACSASVKHTRLHLPMHRVVAMR